MIKICETCGKEFEAKTRANQCPECRETFGKRKNKLDAKLEELHAVGITYAEAQKAETLKMIGNVTVVEPGNGGNDMMDYIDQVNAELHATLEEARQTGAKAAWTFASIIYQLPRELIRCIYRCQDTEVFDKYQPELAWELFIDYMKPILELYKQLQEVI